MKKVVITLLVLSLTIGIAWGTSKIAGGEILDYLFLSSVLLTAAIRFFTSTGGIFSNNLRGVIQSQSGIRVDEDASIHAVYYPSVAFKISLIFSILCFGFTIFYYWDKF